MTPEQYSERLKCIKEKLAEGIFFEKAVRDNLAQRSKRIFTDGENSSGGKIGNYDTTKPLYVNPLTQSPVKFTPKGKNEVKPLRTTVFDISTKKKKRVSIKSDFTERTTKWFSSYSDFRSKIGREHINKNYQLFGNLKSNFENASRGEVQPIKVNNLEYIVGLDRESSLKKAGLEKKDGRVFPLTSGERQSFFEVAAYEQNQVIKTCLNG